MKQNPPQFAHEICQEDDQILQTYAKDMNDDICKNEGYDPVGEAWIMSLLREAYILGYERGHEEA